jgi:hypothetical protein
LCEKNGTAKGGGERKREIEREVDTPVNDKEAK